MRLETVLILLGSAALLWWAINYAYFWIQKEAVVCLAEEFTYDASRED